ncbi:MAG: cation-translocating P-type ATPase [Deltaproteobacteria bacterium]|nr:cation-translocating P-type ATPase [Deltaproteobacteria bacterium]MBW2222871.1 cation-translocating P-type ATPase [Deltaproteobacteria bacterium]MBW2403730.1 cation-translocating P-type ATPase [Deltaproteobacteria bacterium]MBW2546647.1 cation-translocating P-type ATPase [Deltaproteobacteria bacterium]
MSPTKDEPVTKALPSASAPAWHRLPADTVLSHLSSSPRGLTEVEAEHRLGLYGPNELEAADRVSPWTILLAQFKDVLIIILLIATVISSFLGHGVEAIAIAVIVLFAVLLGFIQEYRAGRAIEALRKMAAPIVMVIRGGQEIEIPARELVPGDLILLHAGDKVAADARLVESINLRVDEAALTGESVPVDKNTEPLDAEDLALGDRTNMVFGGTIATYGRGRAVVVGTSMNTQFGRIAQMLQSVESGKTPLQRTLDKLGRALAVAALIVVTAIVAVGLLRGQPLLEMFIFGIALAVAVVPEALPAVVTISLAIGVQRMVKRNALVRRLSAVEALGSTSVICSDKTGTLTKDEMTVRRLYTPERTLSISGSGYAPEGEFSLNGPAVEPSARETELLRAAALVSDAHLIRDDTHGAWHIKGDPTEGAMIVAAAKAGLQKDDLDLEFPRIGEIPFTSEAKRMTTLHRNANGQVAYAKGAPETILDSCSRQLTGQGEVALGDADRDAVLEAVQQMAGEALRVLAVARKPSANLGDAERGMTFLGLLGMIDPPRPEARAAVEQCKQAGIRVVMITGDHPLTAKAVARELGVFKAGRAVTGAELEDMSDEELERDIETIEVYSRVSPADKLRVVTALQERGHVAAMTGDGVNDAPALKKADIGIAMGITGTDVSKEAAAMTLLDDNFASIVAAVEEGRGIFENIKKYLMYLLSSNIGEIGLMAGATIAGLPLPLTAVQILYVNLATDGLPALALAVDPPEDDLMQRQPRVARTGVFTRPVVILMIVGGMWSTAVNLGLFTWALRSGRSVAEAMTMTFVSLVLIQFFKAYNFRSDRRSVLHRPFANKWLNVAILWELGLLVFIVAFPPMHEPFGTYGLSSNDWVIAVCASLTISPVLEVAKWFERRGWFGKLS